MDGVGRMAPVSTATLAALAALMVLGGLLYLLAPILTPFLVAALVGYLFNPLVTRLARPLGGSRTWATVVIFLLGIAALAGLVLVLIPLALAQFERLVLLLPQVMSWFDEWARPRIEDWVGALPPLDVGVVQDLIREHWRAAGGLAGGALGWVSSSTGALVLGLVNLVLIPVVSFYLLRDWPRLMSGLSDLLPQTWRDPVLGFARESDETLGAFLRGQFLVMLALGLFYAIALTLAGLEMGLAIGIVAGLISFVPYAGVIVGLGLAVVAVFFQGDGLLLLLLVLGIFGLAQILETLVLTPWLVGDRTGLHPVAVIFAVLAGGQLFGFLGVLIALPVAAVLAVAVRQLLVHYRRLNAESPDAGPDAPGTDTS